MQIQSGRFYETREGNKVGPAGASDNGAYPWRVGGEIYTDSGAYYCHPDSNHRLDLVAECAEAAAKFKVGDRVRMVREVTGRTTDIPATVREFYVGGHQPYLIEFDTNPGFGHRGSFGVILSDRDGWHVGAADIELIAAKFKVGDRVCSVSDDSYDIDIGDEFTITEIDDAEYISFIDKGGDERYRKAERYTLVSAPAFRLEAGKFYKTADGHKVGPIIKWSDTINCYKSSTDCTMFNPRGDIWRADGVSDYGSPSLVAEWTDTPSIAAPALIVEVGKFYTDADGKVIGPMFACGNSFAAIHGNGQSWRADGTVNGCDGNPKPLVAEHVPAPAESQPKFKVGDPIRHKSLKYVGVIEEVLGGGRYRTFWTAKGWGAPDPEDALEHVPTPAIGDWVSITAERYSEPDAEVGRVGQVRAIAGGMYNVRMSETGLSYAFSVDEIEPTGKPAFVYNAAKPPADDTRSAILGAIEEFGGRAWNDNLLPAEFQPPAVARLMRAAGL